MKGLIILMLFVSCSLAIPDGKAVRQPGAKHCTDCGCKDGKYGYNGYNGYNGYYGWRGDGHNGKNCGCKVKNCGCKDGHSYRGWGNYNGYGNWNGKDCHCRDPCKCDNRRVRNSTCTRVIHQQSKDHIIATCSRHSYFDRLEYDACYELATTCTGVLSGCDGPSRGIWTGIRRNCDGSETRECLNAEYYDWVSTWNNGNTRTSEVAKLCDCKCRGGTLRSQISWIADEPIKGCCDKGVNHQTAVQLKIEIYGKCCSECYLVQGAREWKRPITNRNTGNHRY